LEKEKEDEVWMMTASPTLLRRALRQVPSNAKRLSINVD